MTSLSDGAVAASHGATFYLAKDDQTFGPHSATEIESFLESGAVQPEHLLWAEGMEGWIPISELFQSGAPAAPATIADDEPGPGPIARAESDGLPRRMSMAVGTAIFFHLGLLVTMTLGASTFFKLNTEMAATPAPEEPPMDVTLVTEDDPPPPPPPDAPPPPPDDPPPPPALPDIPIPTVMQPPLPVPVTTPEPVEAPVLPTAHVALVATPAPKPAKVRRPAPVASSPQPAEVADADPSDYLDAPPPSYPYQARIQRQEGTVILLVVIDDAGEPVNVTVGQSSGFPILDSVAEHQVAGHFRFKVGSSRMLRVPIAFHL